MTDAQNETLRERVAKAIEGEINAAMMEGLSPVYDTTVFSGLLADAAIAAMQSWTEDDSDFVAKRIMGDFCVSCWMTPDTSECDLDELSEAITYAVAALGGRLPVSGWRPIGEAPRDGAEFLVWGDDFPNPEVGSWKKSLDEDADGTWCDSGRTPTHFMPIPSSNLMDARFPAGSRRRKSLRF